MTPPCLIASPSLEPTAEEGGETTSVSARTADARAQPQLRPPKHRCRQPAAKRGCSRSSYEPRCLCSLRVRTRARLAHDRAQRRMARASAERGATPSQSIVRGW